MKYLLLIGGADDAMDATSEEICGEPEVRAWVEELERAGRYHGGELLRPAEEAATVRVRDGETLIADGPFAETKEQVGGYSVIECDSMAEALACAARHPVARFGMIEVRPIL